MTHLTDEQLNEVLDKSIFDHSVLGHLEHCEECRTRLDDMRALFIDIGSLPEMPLPRDLTESVLAKLPAPRSIHTWTWLSAAQALGAFAILGWLASSFVLPSEFATYQPPALDSLLASALSFFAAFNLQASNLNQQFSSFIPHLSSLDLQSTTILAFIISAAILWLVGNGLLLRAPQRNNQ